MKNSAETDAPGFVHPYLCALHANAAGRAGTEKHRELVLVCAL